MPFDPTLDELSSQQPQPQGLPPPQPTPYGIARAQEHQQQWSMPGIGEQLGDIASKTAQVPGIALQGANRWVGQRMQAAMEGRGEDEESVKAATDLAGLVFGAGMGGAEMGAAGVAGGRLFLRNLPGRSLGTDSKHLDLIDESGQVIGEVSASRTPGDKTLHVGWTGAAKGPWAGGISEMLSFMTELQHEFPGIEKIQALRVSGARRGLASSGGGGASELVIPKHRRIAPGTPRDPPPGPGTVNPITEARKQQWQQRNPYEKMFTARTRGLGTPPASVEPSVPPQGRTRALSLDEIIRRNSQDDVTSPTFDLMPQGPHPAQPSRPVDPAQTAPPTDPSTAAFWNWFLGR